MTTQIDKKRLNFGWLYSQTNNSLRFESEMGTKNGSAQYQAIQTPTSGNSTYIYHMICMSPSAQSSANLSPPVVVDQSNATSSSSTGTYRMCALAIYISDSNTFSQNSTGACVVRTHGIYYQHNMILDKKTPLIVPAGKWLLLEAMGNSTNPYGPFATPLDFDYNVTYVKVVGG